MSNPVIAFLIALSGGVWIYSKMYKRTMGNVKVSGIIGGVTGLILMLVAWTVLKMVFSN